MNRWLGTLAVGILSGVLLLVPDTHGQGTDPTGAGQGPGAAAAQQEAEAQAAERAALAEAILAREEAATGRAFDPAFRAATQQALAGRSTEELQALVEQEGQGLFGPGGQ